MIAMALTLQRIGAQRRLWLYDTFSGMPPPGRDDFDFQGRSAEELMAQENPETSYIWAKSPLDDVKLGLRETGYPEDAIEFVVGPVESTLPNRAPEKIALLRLDTDWFESTYCELMHLWPRLVDGGVLIIDDYGDWAGAKKAVDRYFAEQKLFPLLHRVDASARVIVKRVT
jgi:O-methyltransferase